MKYLLGTMIVKVTSYSCTHCTRDIILICYRAAVACVGDRRTIFQIVSGKSSSKKKKFQLRD